jgi:hypothetical protein
MSERDQEMINTDTALTALMNAITQRIQSENDFIRKTAETFNALRTELTNKIETGLHLDTTTKKYLIGHMIELNKVTKELQGLTSIQEMYDAKRASAAEGASAAESSPGASAAESSPGAEGSPGAESSPGASVEESSRGASVEEPAETDAIVSRGASETGPPIVRPKRPTSATRTPRSPNQLLNISNEAGSNGEPARYGGQHVEVGRKKTRKRRHSFRRK